MATTVGLAKRWAWCFWVPLSLFALLMMAFDRTAFADKPLDLPDAMVVDVKIEGNQSITNEQIRGKMKTRAGRPFNQNQIEEDLRALEATHWFSKVYIYPEYVQGNKNSFVVVVRVVEMPILKDVQFIGLIEGWGHVKKKDIEEATELKKGKRADTAQALAAINKIKALYEEKGYEKADVKILEGDKYGDTKVVIEIFEGPKFEVGHIDFVGNTFVEDGVLATKIESRRGFFGKLGARRSSDNLDGDHRALVKYYQDNGFFDVSISATKKPGAELGQEEITFTISEGVQYKVGKVVIMGNKIIPEEKLREGLLLKPGMSYNESIRETDYNTLMAKYWAIGCITTKIRKAQPIDEEPGIVRVEYAIEEGNPYILGQIIVKGNGRTKEKIVRREATMAGLLPGETLDQNRVEIFKKRLSGTGYFATGQSQSKNSGGGKPIDIQIIPRGTNPYDDNLLSNLNGLTLNPRMQSPDPGDPAPAPPLLPDPPAIPMLEIPQAPGTGDVPGPVQPPAAPANPGPEGAMPFGAGGVFDPQPNTVPQPGGSPPSALPPLPPGPGQGPPPGQGTPGNPNPGLPLQGQEPSLPNSNMFSVGPDDNEPFKGRSYADIVANVSEAPTGRLMFGFGASSYGGLSGTAILHESNFDIWAIPRSWSELTSGRAFRGAGQEFRISLTPGTVFQQYIVSFRDPYLFDLPLGLGLSAYETSRFYPDYSERRAGARASLGYQFGPQIYADTAVRVEDVDVHGFKYPAPADMLAAAGHTTLATIRPSIKFDNRNNPVAPTSGSYLEAAFEQGTGTFNYSKFTIEGKRHWTLGSRPDGSGKRTLVARGIFGITGRDTPIYERFFAGDYRSMRGFFYRGVGPHVLGVNTGGLMEAINSIEYQFPWTAGDKLQQVFFIDYGTVEANYSFTTFRAAIGTGLRVVIPQITGQLPLAFDVAFPIAKAEGDKVRYFSFFIGAFW
jgi:outer membrane protein insertion porin family